MLKIPRQIYFDQDNFMFYQQWAALHKLSFSDAVRQQLTKERLKLANEVNKIKHAKILPAKFQVFLKNMKSVWQTGKNLKYYHPEFSHDELLYGKE